MATTTDSVTRRFAAAFGLLGQYAVAQQEGRGASSNAQQLTIFYGGMVVAVDGCTPEKAADLIRLTAAAEGNKGAPALVNTPIARKESLRRFLSKRKERAPAPIPVPDFEPVPYEQRKDGEASEPAAKKGKQLMGVSREEAATWLALGSLGGMHARC